MYLSQPILLQLIDILLMHITRHQLECLGRIQKRNYFTSRISVLSQTHMLSNVI